MVQQTNYQEKLVATINREFKLFLSDHTLYPNDNLIQLSKKLALILLGYLSLPNFVGALSAIAFILLFLLYSFFQTAIILLVGIIINVIWIKFRPPKTSFHKMFLFATNIVAVFSFMNNFTFFRQPDDLVKMANMLPEGINVFGLLFIPPIGLLVITLAILLKLSNTNPKIAYFSYYPLVLIVFFASFIVSIMFGGPILYKSINGEHFHMISMIWIVGINTLINILNSDFKQSNILMKSDTMGVRY